MIKPLPGYLVVKQWQEPSNSKLILTETKPSNFVEVVAVAEECPVKIGDIVLRTPYCGQPVKVDELEYIILKEHDILGVRE